MDAPGGLMQADGTFSSRRGTGDGPNSWCKDHYICCSVNPAVLDWFIFSSHFNFATSFLGICNEIFFRDIKQS